MSQARRRKWTLDECRAFTLRCRIARRGLDELIRDFPETPGLTSKILNGFVKARTRLVEGMIRLENLFVDQGAATDNDAIRFVHGDAGTSGWRSVRGRVRADAKPLTSAEWITLGNRVKGLRQEISGLGIELQGTVGQNKRVSRLFFLAVISIDKSKCDLDSIVCDQHPEWRDAIRVFYGPPEFESLHTYRPAFQRKENK